jgi:DNA modification methylase
VEDSIQFVTGNAKSLNIDSNSIDLVVTQLPFYQSDFGYYGGEISKQIGSEKSIKKYINSLLLATKEMERVLKPTGSIFIVFPNTEPTASQYLLKVLKKTDLLLASPPFIWNWSDPKQEPQLGSVSFDYDLVFHFIKSPKLVYCNPYSVRNNSKSIWNISFVDESDVIRKKLETIGFIGNSFRLEIPKKLIEMFSKPGDIVLDPFGGSGTTACEAYLLNRRAISVDVSENQTDLAKIRLGFVKEKK